MNKLQILNANQLKWIACLSMLIDHTGYLLFPSEIALRLIGRLAFPIFAYMIANGFRHTGSRKKYLLRIALFGIFYQPIYWYCMGQRASLNIFFTLALGLTAILLWDLCMKRWHTLLPSLLCAALIAALAEWIQADYGWMGVLFVLSSHLFFADWRRLSLAWFAIALMHVLFGGELRQLLMLGALPILFCYNGKRGRGGKWFFYLFYAVHIPLLYYLSLLI